MTGRLNFLVSLSSTYSSNSFDFERDYFISCTITSMGDLRTDAKPGDPGEGC
jgi:hypothetical protein